jgi:PilZ domain-containing protein
MEPNDYGEAFDRTGLIERRSRLRFSFELRVGFRTLGRSYPVTGMGRIVNMSSTGMLIACQQEVSPGTAVELNIDWPTRLDGRIPLQLVAVGTVVRREVFSFAVSLERYHFRIAGRIAGRTGLPGDEPFGKVAEA